MAAPSSRRRRRIVVLLAVAVTVWWWRRRAAPAPRPAVAEPEPAAPHPQEDPVTEVLPVVPPAGPTTTGGFGPVSPAAAEPHPLFSPEPPRPRPSPRPRPTFREDPPDPEHTIKGNASSMLFHTPRSPYYGRTKADAWFRTEEEARTAGFTEWVPRRRGAG